MKCAYCDRIDRKEDYTKITREHVIPEFIFNDRDLKLQTYFWDKNKILSNQVVVKDVCNVCNNNRLGQLDKFVKDKIWEKMKRTIELDQIFFHYENYHSFFRWLLKVSYNNARTVDLDDAYREYPLEIVEYILGYRENVLGLSLYGNIIPFSIESHKINLGEGEKLINIGMRISNLHFYNKYKPKLSKMVSCNSHYFYIIYDPDNLAYQPLLKKYYTKLNEKDRRVLLKKGEYDFKQSLMPTVINNEYKIKRV